MQTTTLSKTTMKLINEYLQLPFLRTQVKTPYFNNRRAKVRGALRVLVGKGTPQEIVDEAHLVALQQKIDLADLSEEKLTQFLVNNKLGIDCSGFVYHILDIELQTQNKGNLQQHLKFPLAKNPIRKLLAKLRPVENCGVSTLAHDENSFEISVSDIQLGDIIMLLHAGTKHDYNHSMIVVSVNKTKITYVHSFQYSQDGKYNHGVREETITITNPNNKISQQQWNCVEMDTYKQTAQFLGIRRMHCLN